MSRYLHIVCLDVPWPGDYGGAIDMLCRIQALHRAGIKIHLHYFSYNHRGNPNELNQYCETISVYERMTGWRAMAKDKPYIVSSRTDGDLLAALNIDDHPVLLEGIHCTGVLPFLRKEKRVIVRIHNDESAYYRQLKHSTTDILKKWYFHRESRLLKKYQGSLPREIPYACITATDAQHFKKEYKWNHAFFLPAFTSFDITKAAEGAGNFCLYHGNLAVPENEKAAVWLLTRVFPKLKIPLVIAGRKPTKRLDKLAHLCQHTCLVADPSEGELNDLVRKAHINVLPSFSTTGIKLKLLHALFEGRHCVTNKEMVTGTGLEDACHIASGSHAFASVISQLHHRPYEDEEIRLRRKMLGNTYDNDRNAKALIAYLW